MVNKKNNMVNKENNMATNFKDYLLNESLSSSALKDQIYLSAKEIIKGGGKKGQNLDVTAKALSKLYHAREKDIRKMIEDKIDELSKKEHSK